MNGSSPSVNSPQGTRARVRADPAPVYSPSSLPSASKSDTVARAISHSETFSLDKKVLCQENLLEENYIKIICGPFRKSHFSAVAAL